MAHPSGSCRAIGCVQGHEGDEMTELPRSLPEFEAEFPDDAACARWLLEKRWPDGFRCPACGHDKGRELGRERLTLQCAACERQVSVTAGTVLHGSHLGLRTWFLAAWLMATHANGISARQRWRQLGLGSYYYGVRSAPLYQAPRGNAAGRGRRWRAGRRGSTTTSSGWATRSATPTGAVRCGPTPPACCCRASARASSRWRPGSTRPAWARRTSPCTTSSPRRPGTTPPC